MKGQAVHLEHNCFSPPALDSPQATAFGRLQRKHSDPGMAVDLVGQMFTLELSYYRPGECPPLAPGICHLLVAHRGPFQYTVKLSGAPPSHTEPSFCIGVYAALSTYLASSDPYQAPLGGKGGKPPTLLKRKLSQKKAL